MPSDETRALLKRFGIAVTEYEDAVGKAAPHEQLAQAEAEARARLKDVGARVARLRGAAARPATVEDVMTSDPLVMAPSATVEEAHALMKSKGFRHLPIVEGGKVIGILSMTDIGR